MSMEVPTQANSKIFIDFPYCFLVYSHSAVHRVSVSLPCLPRLTLITCCIHFCTLLPLGQLSDERKINDGQTVDF